MMQDRSKLLPAFPPGTSAIAISRLADSALLAELQAVTGYFFAQPTGHYVDMAADVYRALVAEAQDELNRRQMARRLADDRRAELAAILGTDAILIQTNLYLRATRPRSASGQEHIGWHRESFYGPDMDASVNFWVPIRNVSVDNAMRYVPDSHLIPDDAIQTVQEDSADVARYSVGHWIGLLYAPKRIVGGVELSSSRPLVATSGEAAIFSGALIHGAAENRTEQIRFSVDFRAIAQCNLATDKHHYTSGKSYFERL
ncbi:MAG: phytanoyl-CoA dioxygenase family protein [Alphaproteobacteria bacterium]|nr:phytanoyl-CoA dioxygenase family protein [Alphaproteobacteria bacterium]MCW5743810.1 phytanoyl-CoA dioxygenase family protein [Alphaproteobacteria bacterium]